MEKKKTFKSQVMDSHNPTSACVIKTYANPSISSTFEVKTVMVNGKVQMSEAAVIKVNPLMSVNMDGC